MQNPFPTYPSRSLSREDVINYLFRLKERGWEVYSQGNKIFIIRVDDSHNVMIQDLGNYFAVTKESFTGTGGLGVYGRAENMLQFEQAVAKCSPLLQSRPTKTRLEENEPASNYGRISMLIGSARIEAVHDPFLEEKGLANLLTMTKLGASVSSHVRLLTSVKVSKRINPLYVQSWFKELGCSGDIRKSSATKPHRRFMLLSGGQSLI